MYQLVQDFFPSTVGHQPFLHKSRFCCPFFFSSSTVWPMTFSEQHLWIPPPTETFEVPKIKWNFSFFFWIRDFCQNVACNQIISNQFGVLLLHIFFFFARWPIYSLLTSPKWVWHGCKHDSCRNWHKNLRGWLGYDSSLLVKENVTQERLMGHWYIGFMGTKGIRLYGDFGVVLKVNNNWIYWDVHGT